MRERILVTAILLAGLTGCGAGQDPVVPTVLVNLFDRSCSTWDPRIRSDYLEAFASALGSVVDGGQVLATGIDESSLTNRRFAISEFFPSYEVMDDNPLTYDLEKGKHRSRVLEEAREFLGTRANECQSDVFGALELAAWGFASYPEADQRYLVISSDMLQLTRQENIADTLTPGATREIIELHRREGRLASLRGVRVWVVGAGIRARGPVHPDRYRELRAFWLTYLEATGADISADRYGPVPLRFP